MPKHILFIDGIIGAGKSHLTDLIKQKYKTITVIQEPVGLWMESGLLENFYNDPERWCFQLQEYVMETFKEILEQYLVKNDDFLIVERGHLSAFTVFSYLHMKSGLMSREDYEKMEEKYHWYHRDLCKRGYVLDHIYLDVPIETAMKRLQQRNRLNESNKVSIEYQQRLLDRFKERCMTPYTESQIFELIDCIVDYK